MTIKRNFRLIFIFLVIYIIFGIGYTFLPKIGINFFGDNTFFEEFAMSPGDAMFVSFLWPLLFPFVGLFGGLVTLFLGVILSISILYILIKLSKFIDRKFFPENII